MKRLVPLIAALTLVVAACGGSDDDGVATLETDAAVEQEVSDATEGADDEQALLAFSACMRDNGVDQFPDPVLNADGSVDFGGGSDPFGDADQDVAEAAVNACLDELEGLSFAPGGSDFDFNEIQDSLVEFAQCMRDNGVDFDDPDLSNVFGDGEVSSPFGDLDITDPDVQAAVEACQDVFANFGPGAGG